MAAVWLVAACRQWCGAGKVAARIARRHAAATKAVSPHSGAPSVFAAFDFDGDVG